MTLQLPTDKDTNWLFGLAVECLENEFGYSREAAENFAIAHYRNFTDPVFCRSLNIQVQDDDMFHHEGALGIALEIQYFTALKLDPSGAKFLEWRTAFNRQRSLQR